MEEERDGEGVFFFYDERVFVEFYYIDFGVGVVIMFFFWMVVVEC